MKNINGTVTISIEDFDNIRKEYDDLVNDIKLTYNLHDKNHVTDTSGAYLEIDINKLLNLVEKIEKDKCVYFQRQDNNILTIGEDTEIIPF